MAGNRGPGGKSSPTAEVQRSRERTLREEFPAIWADKKLRKAAMRATNAGWHDDSNPRQGLPEKTAPHAL